MQKCAFSLKQNWKKLNPLKIKGLVASRRQRKEPSLRGKLWPPCPEGGEKWRQGHDFHIFGGSGQCNHKVMSVSKHKLRLQRRFFMGY
jgi:hypothetical protein